MISKKNKILIVGLGLIGGSYAKGLTKNGYEVGAISLSIDDINYAIKNNIIKHGHTEVKKEYISQFDIIIFALYPKTFVEWIEKYHHFIKKDAIISDVTGIKSPIIYKIQDILKDDVEFIAAHPMAGKEVSGVINSDEKIFINANYIITPTLKNTKRGINVAKNIAEILSFKNISILTPEKHDEMIAFLSQLTHCIALSLMTCKQSHHLKDYTGDSFRDLTRIANINENMWSELFIMNKDVLLEQMELFEKEFSKLKKAIANEDVTTLKNMMIESSKRRSYFNK